MKKALIILLFSPLFLNAQLTTYYLFEDDLFDLYDFQCGKEHLFNSCSMNPWGFTWTSVGVEAPLSVTIEFNTGMSCNNYNSNVDVNGDIQGVLEGNSSNCNCEPTTLVQTITVDPVQYVYNGINTVTVIEANNCGGLSQNSEWNDAYAKITVEYPCDPTSISIDDGNIDINDIYCGGTYEVSSIPTATNDCNYIFNGSTTDPTNFVSTGTYTINWEFEDNEGNTTLQVQTIELLEDTVAPVPIVEDLPILQHDCSIEITELPLANDNCSNKESVVYNIFESNIFGLNEECGNGSIYDESDFGFTWNSDTPFEQVLAITLELNLGSNCSGITPSFPLKLNDVFQEEIDVWYHCECTVTNSFVISIELDPADYFVNQNNEVIITNPNMDLLGLSPNEDWAGAYARIHVEYNELITASTNDPLAYNENGTYIITWTYEDWNGNTSNQEQTVVINDDEAPIASDCPNDTLVEIDNDSCVANVNWNEPTAIDNCDESFLITSTHSPGEVFSVGTTPVIYTFEDLSGNISTCEFNIETKCVVGLKNPEILNFNVYPNPSTGIFNVDLFSKSHEKLDYQVVDVTGKVVLTKKSDKKTTKLDLTNFEKGVYFLSVENSQYFSKIKLVIN